MEIIKTETVDILLKNKYMVDLSEANSKIIFQCINMGNLYSQMENLSKKIPQEPVDDEIIRTLLKDKDEEQMHKLLEQIKIIMNFL